MKSSLLQKIHIFTLGVIFLIGAYLRLVNYTDRIGMGNDSSRDAFVAYVGARTLQIPLTGPFTSIAPVTTGPWYWIFQIAAHILVPTRYSPWLLLAFFSLTTIIVLYRIGVMLENKWFGLILATITSLSPQQINASVKLTNNTVLSFFASLVVLLFLRLLLKPEKTSYFLLWAVLLGITINLHYQTTGLLSLVALLLLLRRDYWVRLKAFVIFFLLPFLPLLFFELNNHWYNTRHLLQYILVDQYKIWNPTRWLTFVSDYWPEFTSFLFGGDVWFGRWILVAIALTFVSKLLSKKLPRVYILLFISFAIQVVIIRYYRGERFFGYLHHFHPFMIIFLGYLFYTLFKSKFGLLLGSALLLVYVINVKPAVISSTGSSEPLTLETKQLVRLIETRYPNQRFKLYKCKGEKLDSIRALTLGLYINNLYDSNGIPLAYFWGCGYPEYLIDGTKLGTEELAKSADYFAPLGPLRDFSAASTSAIMAKNWIEVSPEEAYQSAARWWMDEQP